MDSDLQKLVTADDIQIFNKSEPAMNAVKLLGNVAAGTSKLLTQHEFTGVRNFLLSHTGCFSQSQHDCSAG